MREILVRFVEELIKPSKSSGTVERIPDYALPPRPLTRGRDQWLPEPDGSSECRIHKRWFSVVAIAGRQARVGRTNLLPQFKQSPGRIEKDHLSVQLLRAHSWARVTPPNES